MAKEPYLEAGKIINTFGVRGEVKLDPWCDSLNMSVLKLEHMRQIPSFLQSFRQSGGSYPDLR